jgi:nucleoside-diphosphate-sugar epimerase
VRPGTPGAALGSSTHELVRRRIEQVLQPFERDTLLPRPQCITWDFSEPAVANSALAAEDLLWLKSRPVIVIHCAASIRFQQSAANGEPYRTNVGGMKNLLALCELLDVRAFHQVSTAYVSPHRDVDQALLETPVGGQYQGGNDYERSKLQAERLVLSARHLGQIVIHRPSIVIGDSRSGFTSTFHGFYAPLQIGWQFARTFGYSQQAGEWFRQQLGLKPSDTKNLVNVDWVAEGIAEVVLTQLQQHLTQPSVEPLILHWTNPAPVGCQEMQQAIADAIQRNLELDPSASGTLVAPDPAKNGLPTASASTQALPNADQFRDQMQAYETYFQSDPAFDSRRSQTLTPDLCCPTVNYALLSKLSDWAIQCNFGWPKPALPLLPEQAIVKAATNFPWLETQPACTIVRITLLGPGSPAPFCVVFVENRCFRVPDLAIPQQQWRLSVETLVNCVSGTTQLSDIFNQGCWTIDGKSAGGNLAWPQVLINHIRLLLQ